MSWFKKAAGSVRKFGHKASVGAKKFGHKAAHVAKSAVAFGEKALPAVEKISGGIAKGLTMVEPLVGVVAPEFLPEVEAAKRGASAVSAGARSAGAGLQAGKGIVRGAKQIGRGDTAGGTANIIQSGLAGRAALSETKRQGSAAAKELNALRR
jgi:hypothetical protein